MKNPARLIAALLIAALAAQRALAAFEDLGAGARAPALGGAFTGLADDAYAIYYNPAGLAQLERPQFSAAYSRLYMGLSDGSDLGLSQMTYAHPLKLGRQGTVGGSWQRFNLSDLYDEQSLYLSYGRLVMTRDSGSKLMLGLNAKYLSHSFKQLPEAANACNGFDCTQGADPVLSGSNSKSAFGADLGLLYRFPRRFQVGLMVQNAMRPDVGFSASDKLPMNLRTGVAYKTLWMNLIGELRYDTAPDGSRDKDLIFAAERYFPSLDHGQFGIRGSLGVGSREWRQLGLGLTYRINKIQFDYGFMMPMGTVKGTAGTHRLGMTLHFGAPTAEDDISRELLEKAQRMRSGQETTYGYEFQEALRPHDLSDPRLAEVRRLIVQGEYRKAHQTLTEVTAKYPAEESLQRLAKRIDLVAFFYPQWTASQEKWEVVLSSSIRQFIDGHDRSAVLHASYALSLNPANTQLDNYLSKLESAIEIKADRLPPDHPRGFIEEQLHRVEAANSRRDYERVQQILKDTLELEPANVTALERVGSVYYILGNYEDAIKAWEQVLPLETRPNEIESIKEYLRQSREKLGRPAPESEFQEETPESAAPSEPKSRTAEPGARPRIERPRPQIKRGDPRDIAALYQKGVEHYARGEYLQATAMFLRILQIDPGNAQALKALERIQQRSPRSP